MGLPQAINSMLNVAIGAQVGNRILPVYAPLNTDRPFCVYTTNGLRPTETKDSPNAVDIRTIGIAIYHETHSSLYTLMESVRDELVYKHETIEGVVIDSCILVEESVDYDSEEKLYIGIQVFDFRIWPT